VDDVAAVCWVRRGVGEVSGLVGQGVREEFYVKVLKFEIMNSRKLFNYSSTAVPRTN
jgi:hypothetical protein